MTIRQALEHLKEWRLKLDVIKPGITLEETADWFDRCCANGKSTVSAEELHELITELRTPPGKVN